MKILVVYYSRTGTTKKVGDEIAEKLDCEVDVIEDVKDRMGAMGYMRSGREAMKKLPGEIQPTKIDPSGYDLVIVGTPIWGWNVSSPVRAYLMQNVDKLNSVAFFCTQGGSGAEKAFKTMEDICHTVPKATLTLLTKEVVKGVEYRKKIDYFLERLK